MKNAWLLVKKSHHWNNRLFDILATTLKVIQVFYLLPPTPYIELLLNSQWLPLYFSVKEYFLALSLPNMEQTTH